MSDVYPHDLEAEMAVLGSIILENEALEVVTEILQDVDFYLEKHRKIFGRMVALSAKKIPIDLVTLPESFRRDGTLHEVGGLGYISDLTDRSPLTSNVTHYAGIVRETAQRRRIIQLGVDLQERALGGDAESVTILTDAGRAVGELSVAGASDDEIVWACDMARRAWGMLDAGSTSDGGRLVIPTGLADLDRVLGGGGRASDVTVIGGRPSMGKTALAWQIGLHAAEVGIPSLYISMETMAEQLGLRALACLGREDPQRMLHLAATLGPKHEDTEDATTRIVKAAERLFRLPLGVYDKRAPTVEEAIVLMRKAVRKHGVRLVVVDYLQLMPTSGEVKRANEARQLGHITRNLKSAAKELDIWIILLSQLNRECEKRPDKRPLLSDLRSSGEIEEHVDGVWFPFRPVYYALQAKNATRLPGEPLKQETDLDDDLRRGVEIFIAKQRNGGSAGTTVAARWFREWQRFENLSTRLDDIR